jgi:hypothetical protein
MTNQNQTLESVLTTTLVDGKQAVGDAVNWALKQAPDLCEQYLRWEFAEAVVCFIFCAIGVALMAWVTRFLWVKEYDDREDGSLCRFVSSIVGAICVALLIVQMGLSTAQALKVSIAPKVYLVEFAAQLIKR